MIWQIFEKSTVFDKIFNNKEDIYIYEIFVKIFLHKICEQMRAEALHYSFFVSFVITSAKEIGDICENVSKIDMFGR